jgi:hypothetical protein
VGFLVDSDFGERQVVTMRETLSRAALGGLRGSSYVTPWSLNRAIIVPSHPQFF